MLIDRGLIIGDKQAAIQILKQTNYYRLSAYSLSLRHNDVFNRGVTFENIYELYSADVEFRQIMMRYCSCVEVAFRSYIAYYIGEHYGPLGYMDANNFDDSARHSTFIEDLKSLIDRSDDVFIEHHKRDLNNVFPIWVIVEVMSFGVLSKLLKNMRAHDRTILSKTYIGFGRKYVENWLQCCSYCRNVAAHGGRFYNRNLRANPVKLSAKDYPDVINTKPFAFVIAVYNLLPSAQYKESMKKELTSLFARNSFVLPSKYGFVSDWEHLMN